jgi:CheY-like chemotaxis protein
MIAVSDLDGLEDEAIWPPRVLLAEDNRDMQQIFSRQLTTPGFQVVGVANGRSALELATAAWKAGHPFDVILMDLEMPIIDGYEATRRLRNDGYPGPILSLSAHSADDYRQESLLAGCNDCLSKPIDWAQLAVVLRKYLPNHVALHDSRHDDR